MTATQGEHTPGPWTIKSRDVVMAGDEQVAMCGFKMGGWPQSVFDREMANAALIAAAPALLAACKAALEAYRNENYDDYFDGERLESMLEQAIEAAQGEAV